VATGKWYSYYDSATWTLVSDVDIDHMVPLKEAWESGARLWSVNNRTLTAEATAVRLATGPMGWQVGRGWASLPARDAQSMTLLGGAP
jgi:hypothetical protein